VTDTNSPTPPDSGALAWRIFHQRPTFTAILDPSGEIREVNAAMERRGLARDQFVGRHIADTPYFAADAAWRRTWDARLAEVRAAGGPVGYEDVIAAGAGRSRYAEATVTPILREGGAEVECFLVEADDTTEQREAELALRDGERRSHDLLAALPAVAWSIDGSGDCDFVNQRWLDELGTLKVRAGEPDWTAVIHGDDRSTFEADWALARGAGVTLTGRYRLMGTGRPRWYEVRIAPVLGDDGAVARWSGVAIELGAVDAPRR
jgi:PAS domain S-box-containing protein